jgi:L-ascorbate metabolism protein UlaG (beta-lactamase superfamily)
VKSKGAAWAFLAAGLCFLSSAAIADATLVEARQKFFGTENVDGKTGAVVKDKVLFSWLTNTTYAVSVKGRVLLLDAFATRLEVEPGRTPFVIKDLVDLKPEAILLGHGHGDHADNAAYIAAKTGAHIYASQETCGVMQLDLARLKKDERIQNDPIARIEQNATVRCTDVTTTDSVPGTQLVRLSVLEPHACVLAFRHLHSILVPRDPDFVLPTLRVVPDPRDAELFPSGVDLTPDDPPLPGQMDLRTAGNPGGAVSIFYHFVLREEPHFTFAWQNSAGALKEGKGNGWDGTPEDGQRLINLMRRLPHTDVHLAPVSTGNWNNNGLRDTVMYQKALKPKIFIPGHHTTGTIGQEGSAAPIYAFYLKQLENMEAPVGQWPGYPRAEWPDIRWLTDPMDYAKPIVFDPEARRWGDGDDDGARLPNSEKEVRVRQYCH